LAADERRNVGAWRWVGCVPLHPRKLGRARRNDRLEVKEEHTPVKVYPSRNKSLPPLRVRIRRPWTAPRDQLRRLIQLLEGLGFQRVGNTFTWELDVTKEDGSL